MTKNSLQKFVLSGIALAALALAPSSARAFHGNLVRCTPSAGIAIPAPISPGLSCTDSVSKLSVSVGIKSGNVINNCVATGGTSPSAAQWDQWATDGINKVGSAGAASISTASLKFKAKVYGICNFSGDANSLGASGSGKFQFFSDLAQTLKVKNAGGSMVGNVAAAGTSSALVGLITKGFGLGGRFQTLIGIDLGDPNNGCIISCNDPFDVCPASPCTTVNTKTDGTGQLRIDAASNADCTGALTPMTCCTGAGTGTC